MARSSAHTRGVRIALVAYSGLFVAQLITFFLTKILVLFAQSLEVLSDAIVSGFLLLSISWSQRPADEYHMFGHGRAQNVAALVAGTVMILFMSLSVFQEAIPRLFQAPGDTETLNTTLALTVLAVSMIVLIVPLLELSRGKLTGASAKAQKVQLLKDEVAYVPALVGVFLVGNGYYLADPATSLVIGATILLGGLYLFKTNVEYLVGKSPGKEFAGKVESTARSVKGVLGVHDLKAEYVGPGVVHAGFHIEVARGTPIEEVDRIVRDVHDQVSRKTSCQDCIVHVDPAS